MYVVKKLRKNVFKPVFIPSSKDIYERVGARVPSGTYSGSDPNELRTISMNVRKLDGLGYMQDVDLASMAYEANQISNASVEEVAVSTKTDETESV